MHDIPNPCCGVPLFDKFVLKEACHFLIDELKATVPIWKKEVYEDGSAWKANKEFKHARR